MKKGFYVLLIMLAAAMVVSCDKTKSYTDMLKAERKAIDRLIRDSGYVILKDFPADSVFQPNEFVKLDNGVYLNIISRGDIDDKAVLYQTGVQCRFIANFFMTAADSIPVELLGPHSNGTWPVEFKYGYYTASLNPDRYYVYDVFISPGLAAGLPYVGNNSYVKLIVPFKQMGSLGTFQSAGTPIFFSKVKYMLIK